jgi:hypothetical protein
VTQKKTDSVTSISMTWLHCLVSISGIWCQPRHRMFLNSNQRLQVLGPEIQQRKLRGGRRKMITYSGIHIQKIGGADGTPTPRDIAVHAGRICSSAAPCGIRYCIIWCLSG